MRIFLTPDATRDYHLKDDTEKRVTFVLKPIGSIVLSYLVEKHKDKAQAKEHSTALLLDLLQHGLTDVKGDGVPPVVRTDVAIDYVGTFSCISVDFLNQLALPVIQEVAAEIASDNFLSPAEQQGF